MNKRAVTLDWGVIEEEELWVAGFDAPAALPSPASEAALVRTPTKYKELWIALMTAAIFFCVLGGLRWHQQGVAAQARSEIEQAVAQAVPLQAARAEQSGFHVQLDNAERQGDSALAQVIVEYPDGAGTRAYRESRFMRRTEEKWQTIEADPAMMGAEQTLKAAHFTIYYRAVDARAVYDAAPRLEQLYAKLRQDFGLASINASATYTVELATSLLLSAYQPSHSDAQMIVPSPALLSTPVEMSAGDVLYQSLVYPLARQVAGESIKHVNGDWQSGLDRRFLVKSALSLWELWEDGGALAIGKAEILRWYFTNEGKMENRQPLPDGYDELCRTYRIWRLAPWQLFIPLACTNGDKEIWSRVATTTQYLAEREQELSYLGRPSLSHAFSNVLMSETVLEYVVATYGTERLPAFVAALGEDSDLMTVIPAVFGVWPDDFEAGWQTFVEQRYLQ